MFYIQMSIPGGNWNYIISRSVCNHRISSESERLCVTQAGGQAGRQSDRHRYTSF